MISLARTLARTLTRWAVHFSSVFEYLFAMGMMWQFATLTGNEKFKGMTWGRHFEP